MSEGDPNHININADHSGSGSIYQSLGDQVHHHPIPPHERIWSICAGKIVQGVRFSFAFLVCYLFCIFAAMSARIVFDARYEISLFWMIIWLIFCATMIPGSVLFSAGIEKILDPPFESIESETFWLVVSFILTLGKFFSPEVEMIFPTGDAPQIIPESWAIHGVASHVHQFIEAAATRAAHNLGPL
ncbi:hypothetical protein KIK06_04605 [Nocardiopsis sp. EMB25]|uniref:hypothetical protein n=1 Tax=Nocardiopsis sp. EMB25 TaxID=2835867 RepID=UPI0022843555|nr:hypothetical protein [Nocardiopsis sp. EMB25]MCY9783171.1 hypothetical protein [Nocardiopsis sp. EMB25]